jgi:hypothetical protein
MIIDESIKARIYELEDIAKSAYDDDPDDEYLEGYFDGLHHAAKELSTAPTVDAVPVVANDRNKLCPINHGLRCKDIEDCAFWCEWGQCAVKAIAVACADRGRTHG